MGFALTLHKYTKGSWLIGRGLGVRLGIVSSGLQRMTYRPYYKSAMKLIFRGRLELRYLLLCFLSLRGPQPQAGSSK